MGRLYIIFMIWAMGSSLLIHNTGLPTGVLWSFLWVGVGLSIGYIAIGFHQQRILVRKPTKSASWNRWSEIFWRIVSWKGLHGVMMLLSWINVAGRTFVTKPDDFDCYTYAVYKPGYTGKNFTPGPMIGNLTLVPTMGASYPRTPWAYREGTWAVIMSVAPMVAGIIAVVYQVITLRRPNGEMVETSEERKSAARSQ
ncbi:hypothetical protein BJ742DRAFT_373687 [Cladochytrium replicatum]|nr:hypothetical protein BJ742DRAFT_373687 [Cladochytrium replicatum]